MPATLRDVMAVPSTAALISNTSTGLIVMMMLACTGLVAANPLKNKQLVDGHARQPAQPQPCKVGPRHALPPKRVQQPKQRRRPRHAQRDEPGWSNFLRHEPFGHEVVVRVDEPHPPQGEVGFPRRRCGGVAHDGYESKSRAAATWALADPAVTPASVRNTGRFRNVYSSRMSLR